MLGQPQTNEDPMLETYVDCFRPVPGRNAACLGRARSAITTRHHLHSAKIVAFASTALILWSASAVLAQTASIVYRGQLNDAGQPANGYYDLRFSLFDAATNGIRIAGPVEIQDVPVLKGDFSVTLDFALAAFNGQARWLEIAVRPGISTGTYTTLTPRQEIKAVPYALHARTAGAVADGQVVRSLNGLKDDVTLVAGSNIHLIKLDKTLTIEATVAQGPKGEKGDKGEDGSKNAWALTGNAGTTPATNYVGTTDNQPLEMKVAAKRALRLEPTSTAPNVIAGAPDNSVASGVAGASIAGGMGNSVQTGANYGVILAGQNNTVAKPYGLAAGYRAKTKHEGAFVWADNNNLDFESQYARQFRVRATGGAEFVTAIDSAGFATASVRMSPTNGVSVTSLKNTDAALELRQGAIKVVGAGIGSQTPAFIHRATTNNIVKHCTVIDHPLCNNDPDAILIVTHNWNPGDATGTSGINTADNFGVGYTGVNSGFPTHLRNKWAIRHLSYEPFEVGAAFNVLVIKSK